MSWFRRSPKPEEIDEELRFHIEEKERRLIAEGFTPAAARRRARKSFGSPAAVREYTRDAWIFRWSDDLWRDLRFAIVGGRQRRDEPRGIGTNPRSFRRTHRAVGIRL